MDDEDWKWSNVTVIDHIVAKCILKTDTFLATKGKIIKFELNFVEKYKNSWTLVEFDHTKWQNTWKIIPSTLQYVMKIGNWLPLSGKMDSHWYALNKIGHRSDAPLIWATFPLFFLRFSLFIIQSENENCSNALSIHVIDSTCRALCKPAISNRDHTLKKTPTCITETLYMANKKPVELICLAVKVTLVNRGKLKGD